MRILKCVLVIILLLIVFHISMRKADDQMIENPEELSLYKDLQQQFTELKILRTRDKMKFETEIKALKTKFRNFEEIHFAEKTEILNLKREVKSLTNKILAIEGVFNPNIWIMQPPTEPPECPGQKSNSGEKGGAGFPGEQEKMEMPGEQGLSGSHVLVGEPGVQGQKNETGERGPMDPVGPEGKDEKVKGDAGATGEFQITEVFSSKESLKGLSNSSQNFEIYPRSCNEIIADLGASQSKQRIYPNGRTKPGVEVLCDIDTEAGNWTIIQKRSSGPKEEFYRNWTEYEEGFGSLDRNFWIGLKTIHALTKDGDQELRIDLWDFEGDSAYAKYSTFSISDSSDFYRLTICGYSGTARDSVSYQNGMRFTTKDNDNDPDLYRNCAEDRRGAWWYESCSMSNLNGLYFEKGETPDPSASGMYWYYWKSEDSLRQVEMKIRRRR